MSLVNYPSLTLRSRSLLLLLGLGACSGDPGGSGESGPPPTEVPDEVPLRTPEQQAELDRILQEHERVKAMTAAELVGAHAVSFVDELPYDPLAASGLELIDGSEIPLDADERAKLAENGFVISERKAYPTFVEAFDVVYSNDLPVYVSADAILHAVHRSYDAMLLNIEQAALADELRAMLTTMRASLADGAAEVLGDQLRRDADLYLAVALGLLEGEAVDTVAGADAGKVADLIAKADAAEGAETVELFGTPRMEDFSQFEPRGHYTDSELMRRYFKAMMWVGRVDLRIIETQPDGTRLFQRRQLEAAFALRELLGTEGRASWDRIDAVVSAFVGEHDYMVLDELGALLADLGLEGIDGLAAVDDAELVAAMVAGSYGAQRISSAIVINGMGEGTLPLSASFALLGQRYVFDSHVFSNVVFDRAGGGSIMRMMPDPLDAAFAALDNDHAATLLTDQLEAFDYAPDLHMMRFLADEHPDEYWHGNLYNTWLSALRKLSPGAEVADPVAAGLPTLAGTEPWARRMLSGQLASWAELRHDTLLYAKQSYTGGDECEFLGAWIDPYPEFFAGIVELADRGQELVETLDLSGADPYLADRVSTYFGRLADSAEMLRQIAAAERAGEDLTSDQLAFVNQAIHLLEGCGSPTGFDGWYAAMFFENVDGITSDPTIADVHTQPFEPGGAEVGRVLHVGTGWPRLAVVTSDACGTPRAFIGPVASYFERVTEDYERLDDEAWAEELGNATPGDVRWIEDLVVR